VFQWVLPIKGEYIFVGDQLQLRPVLPDPCDGRVQEVDYQCALYRGLSIPKESEICTGREWTELLDKVLWHFWSRLTFSCFFVFSVVRVTVYFGFVRVSSSVKVCVYSLELFRRIVSGRAEQ